MENKSLKRHWEKVYKTKNTINEVSWYQDNPQTSVDVILSISTDKNNNIIDVGGGDSKLVDKLLELKFKNLSVLDISAESLKKAQIRIDNEAKLITWIESDILDFTTDKRFDIWHDRATFHFLTEKEDVAKYVKTASYLIKPGGHLIISTFSTSGPEKCSGLDITQYSKNSIKKTFGDKFCLIRSFEQTHVTPFNTNQNFLWSIFKKPD